MFELQGEKRWGLNHARIKCQLRGQLAIQLHYLHRTTSRVHAELRWVWTEAIFDCGLTLIRQTTSIRSVEDEVTAKSVAYERSSPTAKHLAVTALFKEYQVALLQDQTAEEIRLPKIRGKSIEILRSLLPEEAINFRELTLTADYLTIITLLKKLPEISGVLPVNITLQKTTKVAASEKPNGPSLVWTITLLM